MYIRVEKGVSAPISRQIAEQVKAQCLAGILKPGDCIPSVRQLAKDLAVNVNTVVRVYERLTAEGFLEMRHGEGTFVAPLSEATEAAAELGEQREQFTREFEALVRRGLMLGLKAPELRKMLNTAAADAKAGISQRPVASHNPVGGSS
jgi:GntR family transcriptional regulator